MQKDRAKAIYYRNKLKLGVDKNSIQIEIVPGVTSGSSPQVSAQTKPKLTASPAPTSQNKTEGSKTTPSASAMPESAPEQTFQVKIRYRYKEIDGAQVGHIKEAINVEDVVIFDGSKPDGERFPEIEFALNLYEYEYPLT